MKKYKPQKTYPLTKDDRWKKLSGELPVKMMNDYLFRALLQSDNVVLKELLASLLFIDVSEIDIAQISNPILLGEQIDNKTYILDVKVDLNNNAQINLEMQVIRELGWQDRSVLYLSRLYDNVNKGASYEDTKAALQIAFCNFTLYPEVSGFYTTYKLLNVNAPHNAYTEKFKLANIDITKIDNATDEDRKYHVDDWARLFRATTWEELKMLAENNQTMDRAISGVWQLTEDEMIMEQCRAREDFIAHEEYRNKKFKELENALAQERRQHEQERQQHELDKDQLKRYEQRIAELEALLKEQKAND